MTILNTRQKKKKENLADLYFLCYKAQKCTKNLCYEVILLQIFSKTYTVFSFIFNSLHRDRLAGLDVNVDNQQLVKLT